MKNEIPNLNMLVVFSAVMEHGTLTKAAEHLRTNQSTISSSLARLKQETDQELFIRSGRRVSPTAYSYELYKKIKDPIKQLNSVFYSLDSFDPDKTERKFVISSPEHLHWFCMNVQSNWGKPNLSLEIYEQPDTEYKLQQDLLEQRYDMIIDIVVPNSSSIQSIPLFESDFVVVCRANHPRIHKSISEMQYMQERHIVLERKRNESYGLSHYSSIDLTNRDIAYHGHSLYGNMILSSQSDYITVVPISMAMQFKDSLGLQILKPPFEHKPILNHLIWLPKFN
ncbi:MAG: LysR family transcriptional regulator, partial [Vibrio sp.]|uniref:LysR family transcriptional regulator n=1 Tax=Vibrio sp. TaxID=678 RepID=UPI003A875603